MPDRRTRALTALDLAIAHADYPNVLRFARERQQWSQTQLAARFGCHPSQISRLEKGQRPMRDIQTLRRLAGLLGLEATAFGLDDCAAFQHDPASAPRVSSSPPPEEDDIVQRRTFLLISSALGGALATGLPAAEAAAANLDPAALLTARLESILLGAPALSDRPIGIARISSALTAARDEFDRAGFVPLADLLPQITIAAESVARHEAAPAQEVLAQTYSLITRVLIKLKASGLELVSADRALRAANNTGDPLILAEAERMMASVCRRAGHHDRAQTMVLTAAERLDLRPAVPDPRHLALYGMLMCTASYGAARAGNRDLTRDLLADASAVLRHIDQSSHHSRLRANILSHQVSDSYVLGDPASALHHARTVTGVNFPTSEREGRFLVDVALAFHGLDKPGRSYAALRQAELRAPGEVRTRRTARGLASALRNEGETKLPGISALADRMHAA